MILLVGTHCDQCRDEEEVIEKKKDIDERVTNMLENRKKVFKQLKKNLEDNDPSLFSDQMNELDCLLEYTLQVKGSFTSHHIIFIYCNAVHSLPYSLHFVQVLDLVAIDCTRDEDIAKLRRHILKYIRSEGTFPCAERILPDSYEEVEQAIHKLVMEEEIPQHGLTTFAKIVVV